MSKIETRILEASRKTRETAKDLYGHYGLWLNLLGFQIVQVFVIKITEKIANKILNIK